MAKVHLPPNFGEISNEDKECRSPGMMLATLPSYILFYIHTPIKVEGGTKGGVLYYNYFFIPPPFFLPYLGKFEFSIFGSEISVNQVT